MTDRADVSIALGGKLDPSKLAELVDIIATEGLATDWGGPTLSIAEIAFGEPLILYAHEVAWGRFERLEDWCVANGLLFVRCSASCPGQWGAERTVFAGNGDPQSYAADEEGRIVLCREGIEQLGSVDAVLAYFDAADFAVPPLILG